VKIRISCPCHVFSRQPAADYSMIVVFNAPSAEVWIVKAGSITGLTTKRVKYIREKQKQ